MRSRSALALVLALLAWATAALVQVCARHVRAAAILARASGIQNVLARRYDVPITVEPRILVRGDEQLHARLFRPIQGGRPPGIVLVHGVQCMGIDDERLIRLARSFAAAGFVVLTPEIPSLADMRLAPESVEQVRLAVDALAHDSNVRPTGLILIGASFSGGLALRAASDPHTRSQLAAVVSVAGHDDLEEVLRYLAGLAPGHVSSTRARPAPYPYGLQVFVRSYADRMFSNPSDVVAVRDALGAFLCADPRRGHAVAIDAGPDAQATIDDLIHDRRARVAPRVASILPGIRADMDAMSPHGHLTELGSLPVFVLHGADDDVIPASEADAIGRELVHDRNATVLIQRAIQHVDIRPDASAWERFRLVHVLARILDTAS